MIQRFRRRVFSFERLRTLIFLCGAANSTIRDQIARYLSKHHKHALVFYADEVWKHISSQEALNALEMEHQLGLLADAVLIIVESPGTFAELGAFSLSPSLREKLLPILDIAYKGAGSFISSGPVRWVDSESIFKPSIYANFGDFLELARQIEERLKRIRRTSEEQVTDLASKPKHLLFLLCDLLAIIGPATATDCSYYLESILGARPSWSVPSLLGLGVSLRIIGYFDTRTATRFYYRPVTDDRLLPFQHRTMFDLTVERARFLSVLQKIDQAREAISLLEAR